MESRNSITRTKLIVPRRRDEILTRQRLLAMLNEYLDLKLIIVAAPAGYGKTSLLIDFVNHTQWPISWLTLDPLDQSPLRFIAHFIASIQSRYPNFGQNSLSVLDNTAQDKLDIPALVTTLTNDIYENITEHFIIVLDDYQLVEESEAVNQFINRFLQDVDENCHLMVSSRRLLTLPDMPLLVARNQVGGISFEEIAFTANEIQDLLLKNYHLTVSDKSAEEITQQTEGWITGLLLSTQLLDDQIGERIRTARVSGVNLYDYMAQQVFEQQPEDIRDFLLRSSILEEYDVNRCQRVIGKALNIHCPWAELMNKVTVRNLFVLPVGEDGDTWLRYHHLFRDFLQSRMRTERPDETRVITIALADDYADREDWEQAFVLYKQAKAVDKMVTMVEKAGPSMVTGGKLLTLKEWMAALPPDLVTSRPSFLSLQGAILMSTGEVSQSVGLLSEVIDRLTGCTDLVDIEVLSLSLIRRSVAYRMLGDNQKSIADSKKVLQVVENSPELGKLKAEALRNLGVTNYFQGELKEGLVALKESLRLFESYNDQENIPKLLFNIGVVHKVMGDYVLAEMMYQEALDYWKTGGNLAWASDLQNNLGMLQHLRGDYESGAKNFEKAIEYARISNLPRSEANSLTSLGDLYRDLDAAPEALDVYRQAQTLAKQLNDGFLLYYLDLAEGVLRRISGESTKAKIAFEAAEKKVVEISSEYNIRLLSLEEAKFDLGQGLNEQAFEASKEAYEYFHAEGHQNESMQAAFNCALALAAIGDKDQSLIYLEGVLPTLLENDYATPLIVQAREFKDILTLVKGKHELKRQFTRILERVATFEDKLPETRRKIRRQAVIVPFAPPRMIIQSFGKAQVHMSNRLVSNSDWQTQTSRDMFFLFLAHPEGLTKEQVGLYFWPDATPDELKLRFKNTLYRLRRAVGRQTILLQDDYYQFNWSLDYEYDVESFMTSIEQSQKAREIKDKIQFLKTAIDYYKGEYLSEIDEIWAITDRQRYYQMYLDALMRLAAMYMERKAYKTALRYCYQALTEDACLEDAHRLAMRIHAATGNRAAIVRQYERCRVALNKEISAPPSQQTRELYETLIQK
ncbi:MAG: tetratricopeptide repeat protein [Anaerolineaceae bacterium]|nr:tetratricopeptide repeat protein [Anaerolineaceae bacterium]